MYGPSENFLPPQVRIFSPATETVSDNVSYLKLTSFQTRNFRRYSIAEELAFTI